MKITDLLDYGRILLNAAPASKEEAIDRLVQAMAESGNLRDKERYRRQVYLREKEGTTGIGEGIAIPHGKSDAVKAPGLAAMTIKDGVDFQALDGEPVHLIFLIAAPDNRENVHLEVLSRLSVLLMREEFAKNLRLAKSAQEFLEVIDRAEQEEEIVDQEGNGPEKAERPGDAEKTASCKAVGPGEQEEKAGGPEEAAPRILAVTSCPTGIAHTYMAAESLKQAAEKAGVALKVETRGSGGAKNVLTKEEIRQADCIIVAADAKVPMERFAGKPLIVCKVSDGIAKAQELIERAERKDAPIYRSDSHGEREAHPGENHGNTSDGNTPKGKKSAHQIYVWLMNGVSHMLPFVVGGGILIALAFLADGFSVDLNTLPEEIRSNFGSITPFAALLKRIGDTAFGFMLPVLAGFIAEGIADRPGLAPGVVGGMIASLGKSGFLGALAAGFLAGFLVLFLQKIFEKLPEAIEKLAPVLFYPLFGIFFTGFFMIYLIEPFVGIVNTALQSGLSGMGSQSKILLGMIVAGMMAVDMGGPFNKAAYVFGTASIASGNYDIMAAVMAGGMVPPCAIALATLLFPQKFTPKEREAGPVNFLMGLAFITEGAIPFAASDPFRVLPSCIAGSALAGALSMAFGCTLMAPHGGIFVFPVVGNGWWYLLCVAAGTVLGALLLGSLKQGRKEQKQ